MTKGCVTPKKIAAPRMDLILSWPKPSRFFNASTQMLLGFVHRRWRWSITLGSYERFTVGYLNVENPGWIHKSMVGFFSSNDERSFIQCWGPFATRDEWGYPTSWRVRIPSRPSNIGIHPDRIQVDITPQELLYHLIASKDDFLGYCS